MDLQKEWEDRENERYERGQEHFLKAQEEQKDFFLLVKEAIRQLERMTEKKKIWYLRFSFLQTPILFGEYPLWICACGKQDWLDEKKVSITIDLSKFFQEFEQITEQLKKEVNGYRLVADISDVEKKKLLYYRKNCQKIILLLKENTDKWWDTIESFEKGDFFQCTAGEYLEKQEELLDKLNRGGI